MTETDLACEAAVQAILFLFLLKNVNVLVHLCCIFIIY